MAASRTWLAAVSVLSATLLASCDSDPKPRETPTPPPSSTTSSGVDPAPPVRTPLEDDAFAAAPCTSLTATQLADLRLSNSDAVVTESCTYTDLDLATELTVSVFYFGADNGLGELYDMNVGSLWTDWKPVEVDGYPAVRFRDYKAANVCDIGVGVSDTTYFRVQVLDPDVDAARDTCGLVVDVGSAVLATIKAAN